MAHFCHFVKFSASAKAPGFGSSHGLCFPLPCYALQLLVVIKKINFFKIKDLTCVARCSLLHCKMKNGEDSLFDKSLFKGLNITISTWTH